MEIVKHLLAEFGDVAYSDLPERRDIGELYIPPIFGRILTRLGFPESARTLINRGLPDFILNGSIRTKCAFLEEYVPEDGSFDGKQFDISAAVVLHLPESDREVPEEIIDFVIRNTERIVYKNVDEETRYIRRLYPGILKQIVKEESSMDSAFAETTQKLIEENPHKLLSDLAEVCKSLGIQVSLKPQRLEYSEGSGRLSLIWRLRSQRRKDTMRWALLAPPNDVNKKGKVMQYISENPKLRKLVEDEFSSEA
jgi:hypothetical protein